MSDFEWAIKNDDIDVVRSVLDNDKSKANVQFSNGRYPLHMAADYGHKEIIEYLLSKGSDVNRPDKYNITPLLSAIYENHSGCVKVLLEKGADKNGKAPDGSTYIECAETDEMKQLLK